MGVRKIILGKFVIQEIKTKEKKLVCEDIAVLHIQCFVHVQQVERKKESLDLEQPWRENSRAC
jgi:hypothetical protein